eukprot:6337258-Prorocentrum_lima.AAC.1
MCIRDRCRNQRMREGWRVGERASELLVGMADAKVEANTISYSAAISACESVEGGREPWSLSLIHISEPTRLDVI